MATALLVGAALAYSLHTLPARSSAVVCSSIRSPWRTAQIKCDGAIVPSGDDEVVQGETKKLSAAEVEEVGNLVEDDEWLGLGMELAIVLRCAIRESTKKNVKEFTGKEDYAVGDLSKELDARVKQTVADLRGKDEYELGDLSLALDQIAKDEVKKMTGKDDVRAAHQPKARPLTHTRTNARAHTTRTHARARTPTAHPPPATNYRPPPTSSSAV